MIFVEEKNVATFDLIYSVKRTISFFLLPSRMDFFFEEILTK